MLKSFIFNLFCICFILKEESFEIVKNWTNDDIKSLLSQVPIARMYEHILLDNKGTANLIVILDCFTF